MSFPNCERRVEEINSLVSYVVDDNQTLFFERTNVIKPDFVNSELSFIRLVTWLYTIHFEVGKIGISIVIPLLDDNNQRTVKNHRELVRSYRTKLQHNLDRSQGSREFKMEKHCMDWSKTACGNNVPRSKEDWKSCSDRLINDAMAIFELFCNKLEQVTDNDRKKSNFKENWNLTLNKNIEPYLFDSYIEEFLTFVSTEDFDVVKYRNKNLDKWRQYLRQFKAGTDIKKEIKRIVQSTIVRDFVGVLPITVVDIEKEFEFSKEVFDRIYEYIVYKNLSVSCSKDELIDELKLKFPEHLKV